MKNYKLLYEKAKELIEWIGHEPEKDDEDRLKILFVEGLVKIQLELSQLESEPDIDDKQNLFSAYSDFVWSAFPDASCNDHLKKLKIEADEAMQDNRDIVEFADCLGAIYGAVTKAGFSYSELIKAGFEKLAINKTRKWELLPDGTYQHIKSDIDDAEMSYNEHFEKKELSDIYKLAHKYNFDDFCQFMNIPKEAEERKTAESEISPGPTQEEYDARHMKKTAKEILYMYLPIIQNKQRTWADKKEHILQAMREFASQSLPEKELLKEAFEAGQLYNRLIHGDNYDALSFEEWYRSQISNKLKP